MRMKTLFAIIAVGVAANAMAADSSSLSATTTAPTTQTRIKAPQIKIHVANPFARTPPPEPIRIKRYGRFSSRPWTQIVGWHPGAPSAFMDLRRDNAGWPLFWIGAAPSR